MGSQKQKKKVTQGLYERKSLNHTSKIKKKK